MENDIVKMLFFQRQRQKKRWKIKTISGAPPLSFKAKAGALKNYRIYGNTAGGEAVGDLEATGEHAGEYKVPVTVTNGTDTETTNIYIPEQIKIEANKADVIDYKTQTLQKRKVIYGWHVDPSISDSFNAVTYLEDAVGLTPASMGADTFSYGSWGNAFFMPKPCMLKSDGTVDYYLFPNDYTKKMDGTPSDVANPDYDGNAMMEWGKIWYKFAGTEIDGEGYFYVSNYKVDNTYHCWCNIDSQNNETDHFYTAIYNGTGTTKLRSISGVALTNANGNGGTTTTQEVARATANNTSSAVEWYIENYSDRMLINSLLVLIGKSINTQTTFGRGLDTGGQTAKEAYVTGTLNDKGLFWGVTANGNSAVKVFGMENYWSCVWHRVAGCISVGGSLKVKLTYNDADGSQVNSYNENANGYIDNGTNPNTNDFVEKMRFNSMGYTPMLVSSKQGYYGDYFYQNTGTRYLLLGGTSASGVHAGAFCFYLRTASGYMQWDIAAALSCKPLAGKNPTPDSIRSITLPALPVLPGTNTLTVGTAVQPSGVEITGRIR